MLWSRFCTLTVLLPWLQGYEKANATQDTMYQVRWGADYLMKMIGSGTGTNADYLEIIYQVHLLPLLSNSHMKFVGLLWEGVGGFHVLLMLPVRGMRLSVVLPQWRNLFCLVSDVLSLLRHVQAG